MMLQTILCALGALLPIAIAQSTIHPVRPLIPVYQHFTDQDWENLIGTIDESGLSRDDVFIILNANDGFVGKLDNWNHDGWRRLASNLTQRSQVLSYINMCNRDDNPFDHCHHNKPEFPALQGGRPLENVKVLIENWLIALTVGKASFERRNLLGSDLLKALKEGRVAVPIDGFFLDDTPMDGLHKENIKEVIEYIRGLRSPPFMVFTNPGVPADDEDLLRLVETSVHHENSFISERQPHKMPDRSIGEDKHAMLLNRISPSHWEKYLDMAHQDGYGFFYASDGGWEDPLPSFLAPMLQKMNKFASDSEDDTTDDSCGKVVLEEDFDRLSTEVTDAEVKNNWWLLKSKLRWTTGLDRVAVDQGRVRVDFSKKCGGLSGCGAAMYVELKPMEEATLQYSVKFSRDYDWTDGGKLPGLQSKGGPSGKKPKEEGWTSRQMWRNGKSNGVEYPPGSIMTYLYHPTQKKDIGDNIAWKHSNGRHFQVQGDKWYTFTVYIKMNTPGYSDGVQKVWVNREDADEDAELVLDLNDILYRKEDENIKVRQLDFITFHGGGNSSPWQPNKDQSIWFDNFQVREGLCIPQKRFG